MNNATIPAVLVALIATVSACDRVEPVEEVTEVRTPIGKADILSGSCASSEVNYCGGQGDGSCYCDEACSRYGDCCHDVDVCLGEPEPELLISKGLHAPESVVFDPRTKTYFVSNLAHNILETDPLNPPTEAHGYLSRHAADGSVLEERFAEGFVSAKGVAVAQGVVYVADPTVIRGFDVESGEERGRYTIDGGMLFNDIAPARDGSLYVTDTGNGSVYRIDPYAKDDEAMSVVLRDERFEFLNGVTVVDDKLILATTGLFPSEMGPGTPGHLYTYDLREENVEQLGELGGKWDGVVELPNGMLAANDFMTGQVFVVDPWTGEGKKISDAPFELTPMVPAGLADMGAAGSMLLIPSMFTNEVYALTPSL